MNQYRHIILVLLMTFSLTAIAEEYNFVVWTKLGEQINFPLSEKPKLTHYNDNFIVTTSTTMVEYPKTDIKKFTLLIPDGVDNIENSNANLLQQDNSLICRGFRDGSIVKIFNINGQLLSAETINNEDVYIIDLSTFNKGIYIVSTESITYKIIRQ